VDEANTDIAQATGVAPRTVRQTYATPRGFWGSLTRRSSFPRHGYRLSDKSEATQYRVPESLAGRAQAIFASMQGEALIAQGVALLIRMR